MADQADQADQGVVRQEVLDDPFNINPVPELPPAAEMRPRGMSIRSGPPMPTVPENTPATTIMTVATNSEAPSSAPSVGERLIRPVAARLEVLQRERPGMFWEQDTTAPDNTPINTTILRPQNLPAIEEIIQRLPPPRTGPHSHDGVSDFDVQSVRSGDLNSIRTEFGSPSMNPTRRAPPPTPMTQSQFARSAITGAELRSPAEPIEPSEPVEQPDSSERATIMSIPKGGVLEYSDWEGDVEEMMVGALARLAQLAHDKAMKDSSVKADEYYRGKLNKIINHPERRFRPGPIDLSSVPMPDIVGNPMALNTPTRVDVKLVDLRMSRVEERVDRLERIVGGDHDGNADGIVRKKVNGNYENVD